MKGYSDYFTIRIENNYAHDQLINTNVVDTEVNLKALGSVEKCAAHHASNKIILIESTRIFGHLDLKQFTNLPELLLD